MSMIIDLTAYSMNIRYSHHLQTYIVKYLKTKYEQEELRKNI